MFVIGLDQEGKAISMNIGMNSDKPTVALYEIKTKQQGVPRPCTTNAFMTKIENNDEKHTRHSNFTVDLHEHAILDNF